MRTVLFVHQSCDMYGSDRVLLALVKNLDQARFTPIVILPCEGPLMPELQKAGVRCHVVPLIRVGRSILSIKGLLGLPLLAWRSVRSISDVLQGEQIDIVHSNTLAVLSGAVWACLKGVPHVWHVHEIIERPVMVRKGFSWLLRVLSNKVICNSRATMEAFVRDQPILENKSVVVWNGVDRKSPVDYERARALRSELSLERDGVLVAMLGRVNRLKGQDLLIGAAEKILKNGTRRIHFLMVGGPPNGQEHFLLSLRKRINDSPARECISVFPFTADNWRVWDSCDIAVVPSTEPESFGMVAVEAMASGRPVIAANHGGLPEIVLHRRTGLLFEPNNSSALADAISELASDKKIRSRMGRAGKQRASHNFSEDAYVAGVSAVYDEVGNVT